MAEIRPFAPSKDRTPRYTVKEVSELTGSPHTRSVTMRIPA